MKYEQYLCALAVKLNLPRNEVYSFIQVLATIGLVVQIQTFRLFLEFYR